MKPRKEDLDIDDTFCAAHGGQQLAFWNAHENERGFSPMHIYHVASGAPVVTILRTARTPAGTEVRTVVKHLCSNGLGFRLPTPAFSSHCDPHRVSRLQKLGARAFPARQHLQHKLKVRYTGVCSRSLQGDPFLDQEPGVCLSQHRALYQPQHRGIANSA